MIVNENYSKNFISLFRAVGADEFKSIIQTKKFSFLPKGVDVKYFGVNLSETLDFANEIMNIALVAVIEVVMIDSVIERIGDFTNVDPYIFKSGTVEIHSEYLDEFNNNIVRVNHIF
ncbi:MAG: hypothetical protein FWH24_04385 [Oscillospiraceae bacterium]|nr:hypothetical protein [Oscillospiraceae bacterium]